MFHFEGANVSECRKYDLLTFCEIISRGPFGGLRFQVSALRSQVSGVRPQKLMLSLTRFASFLIDAIAYQIFTFWSDAVAYQIFTFLIDAIAYQICPFYN